MEKMINANIAKIPTLLRLKNAGYGAHLINTPPKVIKQNHARISGFME
jgi:hypothetical protein